MVLGMYRPCLDGEDDWSLRDVTTSCHRLRIPSAGSSVLESNWSWISWLLGFFHRLIGYERVQEFALNVKSSRFC